MIDTETTVEFNTVFEGLATATDNGDGTFSITISDRTMVFGIQAQVVVLGAHSSSGESLRKFQELRNKGAVHER